MAVYRNALGDIDRLEFENHLKAQTRKEGYMEIIMYTPDTSIQVGNVTSDDKLNICDMTTLTNIDKYTSNTIATLEENLWLLNGKFIIYQGGNVNGYISNSISDDNGEFMVKPTMTVQLSHTANIENFAVLLNSAVPSGYPKDITVRCYDNNDTLLKTSKVNIEWQEETGEVDEDNNPIYKTVVLDTLPSVNFELNTQAVDHIVIEFGNTRFRNRRIRVSSVMFGKTLVLDQDNVLNVSYSDKTSYVADTLPSRTFRFDVNNYSGIYNVDNPNNGYVKLNRQTRIRFRNGYNVMGYQYDENGKVLMENGFPVLDLTQDGVEIEWDNWKELRLMDVSANADESATFTAGSLLDIMEDVYVNDIYSGEARTVEEITTNILTFMGLDLNSVEWSSDSIKKPTYQNGTLLPYEQWEDTPYNDYKINTSIPEIACKQVIQLLAFTIGATILIKDNGHIKFANLNIKDPKSFTNTYTWDYTNFLSIPAAEQLESVSNLNEISLPKYNSYLDYSGKETFHDMTNDIVYSNCTVVTTLTITSTETEITYNNCLPVGCRMANDDESGASIAYVELYSKRGILYLGGYTAGTEAKVELIGYPIKTESIQERNVTSNSLVLDTKIMNYDVSTYSTIGTVLEKEQIKRKYSEWYKKKFKYKFQTRGEPLVNAGDYGIIQTQFTEQMPVYILQNSWTFNGTWSGDMEVIALD
jgi:hypothetical protein